MEIITIKNAIEKRFCIENSLRIISFKSFSYLRSHEKMTRVFVYRVIHEQKQLVEDNLVHPLSF